MSHLRFCPIYLMSKCKSLSVLMSASALRHFASKSHNIVYIGNIYVIAVDSILYGFPRDTMLMHALCLFRNSY